MLIAAIMSLIATIFVVGVYVSYPEGFLGALAMGIMAVVIPVIGYLYYARWMKWLGTVLDK